MRDDGGPAFARPASGPRDTDRVTEQQGMSLRDYFAGQALAGLLAASDVYDASPNNMAAIADTVADAMIRRRRDQ